MSRTKKPCPGCGVVYPYRSAAVVCHSCANKLRRFDQIVEQQRKVEKEGFVRVKFHGRVRLSTHCSQYHEGRGLSDGVIDFLGTLGKLAAETDYENAQPLTKEDKGMYSPRSEQLLMRPSQVKAIQDMLTGLQRVLDSAYEAGEHHGCYRAYLEIGELSQSLTKMKAYLKKARERDPKDAKVVQEILKAVIGEVTPVVQERARIGHTLKKKLKKGE